MLTKLAVDSDLTHTSLDTAIGLYMEEARGVAPTTLLTSTWNAETAYRIMLDRASKLVIVPVPGFPRDAFAVTGQCGLVYSPGA